MRMRKKLFALLLAACLTAVPAAGAKAGYQETLDAAFESGQITLVETEHGGFDFEKLSASEPLVLDSEIRSISPAGNSALLYNEAEELSLAVYEDSVFRIRAAEGRGAEDTYGKMDQMFHSGLLKTWIGQEGVTWSHNGRYAVITNEQKAMASLNFHDPLVIDLTTGEAFLTATWPGEFNQAGSTTAAASCFSLDDRYLYYIQWGGAREFKYSVLCYDFETDETSVIYNGEDDIFLPHLAETAGGALIMPELPFQKSKQAGILTLNQNGDEWTSLLAPSFVWKEGIQPVMLLYSPESGYALTCLQNDFYATEFYDIFFQCFRPDDAFEDYGSVWCLPLEGNTAVKLPISEIGSISRNDRLLSYYEVSWLCLSPDGNYAAALCRADKNLKLLMIRLSDMTYREVSGLELTKRTSDMIRWFPVLEWNYEDLLILTEEGYRTYRIE